MQLQEGIKLFIQQNTIDLEHDRLSLYEGTILVEKYPSYQSISSQYYSQSFIPKLQSRLFFEDEKKLLYSTDLENYKMGESLGMFKIPEQVLSCFNFLKDIILKADITNIALALESEESKIGILKALSYIEKLGSSINYPVLALNLPNLITVSRQPRGNDMRYMGLHIDGWGLPYNNLENRHLSPVKIGINLGIKERYLLFINLSLKEIRKILIASGIGDLVSTCEPWNMGNLFMKTFPNYPVIRLKILPNEAYIAPVQNMIHDGSTLGSSSYDVNFQINGYFKHIGLISS